MSKSYRSQNNVSLPSAFSRNSQPQRQDTRPRLVVVDEYDLARARIKATEVDTGKKFEIYIDPAKAAITSGGGTDDTKWRGNNIDTRMAEQVPVGSRIILEHATTEKWLTVGGEKVGQIKANWIVNVPEASPDKCFTGVITVNSRGGERITNVQVWNDQAINVQTPEGEQELMKLIEDTNRIAQEYSENKRVIGMGVQFRAMVPKETTPEGKTSYEVIDSTGAFDWVQATKDEAGNDIPAHPLDGNTIEAELQGYMDYLYGKPEEGIEARFPPEVLDKLVVEVMPYKAYQGAPRSDAMKTKNEKRNNEPTPLYWMANTKTKVNPEEDNFITGKNWAVRGIVMLTGDKRPEERGQDWEDRNLVTRLFVDSWKGNVHKMVRASDGGRVTPHPGMDRPEEERTNRASVQQTGLRSAPSQSAPAASAPSQASSLQAPASDAFAGNDPFATNDPFAAAFDSAPAAPAAAAQPEPAAAAPAAEPTPAPAAETPAAPAPAAPASGGGHWARRNT